jgi:hypothetical protein
MVAAAAMDKVADGSRRLRPSEENMAETTPYIEYAFVLPSSIRSNIV